MRVAKFDPRIVALGDVDELNSALGVAMTFCDGTRHHERLRWTQRRLFSMGADLADPDCGARADALNERDVETLDAWLQQYRAELPRLRHFVLPGGGQAAAAVHLARAICRRAERSAFALSASQPVNTPVLTFLNRLSDVLFEMARGLNAAAGVGDTEWLGRRERPEPPA